MAERLYDPEVECEATRGSLYDTEVVGVPDETDNRHFLRVPRGMVHRSDSKAFLPVGIVDIDRRHGRVLIQLPYEIGFGARWSTAKLENSWHASGSGRAFG